MGRVLEKRIGHQGAGVMAFPRHCSRSVLGASARAAIMASMSFPCHFRSMGVKLTGLPDASQNRFFSSNTWAFSKGPP